MKKLDIPCGEGCVAVILDEYEINTISKLLEHEAFIKRVESDAAYRSKTEFNQAVGLVKEPEKPPVDPGPPEFIDTPF